MGRSSTRRRLLSVKKSALLGPREPYSTRRLALPVRRGLFPILASLVSSSVRSVLKLLDARRYLSSTLSPSPHPAGFALVFDLKSRVFQRQLLAKLRDVTLDLYDIARCGIILDHNMAS